jgi:proteasome accessory factor B
MLSARRHGLTVREMAHEMKVAEKTIRRDLVLFRKLGFALENTEGDHGRKAWRAAGNWCAPTLNFTFDEAAALYLGRQFMEPLAGTPFWSSAHRAWQKIRASLGETALSYLDRFPRLFHCTAFGAVNYASKAEILDSLTIAIEDHKAAHLTYRSQQATEPVTYEVYPLSLIRHKYALYLLAFAPEHDQVRTYKVARIEDIEVTSFTHQRFRDFDSAEHLAGSFGIFDGDGDITVSVKFLPGAARYVCESKWHRSQAETKHRDGSVTVRFRLSNTVEVKSWVLGFGASAIVLEPESLRAEVAVELEGMLAAYAGSPVEGGG